MIISHRPKNGGFELYVVDSGNVAGWRLERSKPLPIKQFWFKMESEAKEAAVALQAYVNGGGDKVKRKR